MTFGSFYSGIRAQELGRAKDGFDPDLNGPVRAVAVQTDGKLLVGGGFTQLGGETRNGFARIHPDGSVDTAFVANVDGAIDPTSNNWVLAVAVEGSGDILVGGGFTSIDGAARNRLARIKDDGTVDATFDPNVNGTVLAITVQADGKILIGGHFTSVGGVTRNHIARLESNGALDAGFDPGADGPVAALAIEKDGSILAGGSFANFGGAARSRIARVSAAGTLDPAFAPAVNDEVLAIQVRPDWQIVIGGKFTDIGGQPRNRMARLSQDGSVDAGYDPNANEAVHALERLPDGRILAGGMFTQIGGAARNYGALLDEQGVADVDFDPAMNGAIHGIVVQGDARFVMGGDFVQAAGETRNRLARFDGGGYLDKDFIADTNGVIRASAVDLEGRILIGGAFTEVDGVTRNGIARVSHDGTLDPGFNPNATGGVVHTIELLANGHMLMGGSFTAVSGQNHPRFVMLLSNGSLNGYYQQWNDPNGTIYGLAEQPDGEVLAVGAFTQMRGYGYGRGTRLNAGGDQAALYFSLAAGPHPRCIALQTNGGFLVGGNFTTAMGATRNAVVRGYDDTQRDEVFKPNVTHSAAGTDASVQSLSPQSDGKVVLAGSFTTVGGEGRSHLARVTGGHAHATLEASADGKRVSWSRGGANAVIDFVDFDYSLDGGATWHELGSGTRIGTTSDWERTGLNLPKNRLIQIRAQGHDFSAGDLYGGASAYAAEAQVYLDGSQMRINEVDALTQSGDTREFIELFDGGDGNTALDGLAVVLFDGATDNSYQAIDLDGQTTDANGYFVIGNAGTPNVDLTIPDGTLQNGADAVALYEADGTDFPNGTGVTVSDLIDAVVYGTGGEAEDPELLALLLPGQSQVDESGNGDGISESILRIPNGGGFQRETAAFSTDAPNPGAINIVLPPMDLDLTDASDSGISDTDDLTNDNTPTISGTALPGGVVELTSSLDGVIGSETADGFGSWSITPGSPMSEGDHMLTATVGNSGASDPLMISIDTTRPVVTVEVDPTQDQPATGGPVNFDIGFSEMVVGFDAGDVTLGGSAGPSNPQLAMDTGNAYDFAVQNVAGEGEIIASVVENAVNDPAGNGNLASTSLDNRVEIDLFSDDRNSGSLSSITLSGGVGTVSGWLGSNDDVGGGDEDTFLLTVTETGFFRIRTTGDAATRIQITTDGFVGILNQATFLDDDDRGDSDNFDGTIALTPGDYRLFLFKDVLTAPGAAYTLEVAESAGVPQPRIDQSVGKKYNQRRGVGRYRTVSGQMHRERYLYSGSSRLWIWGTNTGDYHDQFRVYCAGVRGSRFFRVTASNAGLNVKSALATGQFEWNLEVGRTGGVWLRITPNRSALIRRVRQGNGRFRSIVLSRGMALTARSNSVSNPAAWDMGRIIILSR